MGCWKWMVGILLSFWDGLFPGAFAVSFRECILGPVMLVCLLLSLVDFKGYSPFWKVRMVNSYVFFEQKLCIKICKISHDLQQASHEFLSNLLLCEQSDLLAHSPSIHVEILFVYMLCPSKITSVFEADSLFSPKAWLLFRPQIALPQIRLPSKKWQKMGAWHTWTRCNHIRLEPEPPTSTAVPSLQIVVRHSQKNDIRMRSDNPNKL